MSCIFRIRPNNDRSECGAIMGKNLADDLRRSIQGEVRDDDISKAVYSVDASIYEIAPLAVAVPKSRAELLTAIEIARHYSVPVIPRGAATGIAGGCIGSGLVIDTSKYLNKILEVNYDDEYAICEPGVVQSQLNAALAPHDYRLGPDTSTGNRATLGGMLANNAAGSRSLKYGRMSDHILETELVLYSGEILTFAALDNAALQRKQAQNDREGAIYREVNAILSEYGEDIRSHIPNIPRRASGYNLNELLPPNPLNISKVIAGSEGSLGIATSIRVKICRRLQLTGLCLIHCSSLREAFSLVTEILKWHPIALEMIDHKIITAGRSLPLSLQRIGWLEGDPQAVLVAEFEEGSPEKLKIRLKDFSEEMTEKHYGYSVKTLTSHNAMADVWAIREAGLGLLLSKRSYSRAIAFLEDIAVGPEHLAPFMSEFLDLLARHGKEAGCYGHVGAGCMHVRPYIDLRNPEEIETIYSLMNETSDLLLRYHGAVSGEHGDGLVRSWLNEKMFGKRVYEAFTRLKKAFDPAMLMNPGKVIATQGVTEHLRMSPAVKQIHLNTQFDFSRQGGFNLAVDLCNGNGLCRKREGLMCPSFQAYGDEFHSTRARAQSLREIVNGKLPIDALTSKELYHVLEYCLECKGCKTECPSQVDMAKMKAEFLYHYQERWGYSLRSRLFGHIATMNKLMSPIARVFNVVGNNWLSRQVLSAIGIAPERPLPPLAHQRFSQSVGQSFHGCHAADSIVLFIDTYTEFNHPEIGMSALQVLQAMGWKVIIPPWQCCGRPLISKGMLTQAKAQASKLIDHLRPYIDRNLPIVGLEPSCILTIKDDYPDLVPSDIATKLAELCVPIDVFLANHLDHLVWIDHHNTNPVLFHTHCHQKALTGSAATKTILASIPNLHATEIDSGCCGLAGSFGYEKEHYAFSMKIGENRLFPAIRSAPADAVFVANGMSCRSQIAHGTEKKAIHLVELLSHYLKT